MKSFFSFFFFLFIGLFLNAQEVTHIVKAKETLYGISKTFNVSIDALKQNNSFLSVRDLQIGDEIVISTSGNTSTAPNGYYDVKENESIYFISSELGVSVDQLYALNKNLRTNGLKAGQKLLIPKKDKINILEDDYVIHFLGDNETMFSLVNYYGISIGEFIKNNPKILTGISEGTGVKIPIDNMASLPSYAKSDSRIKDDSISLVLILPLNIKEKSNTSKKEISIDFILGAKLALQKASITGKKIKLKVIDSSNGLDTIIEELKTINLEKVDAIIGPLYEINLAGVATYLSQKTIPIISPFASSERITHNKNIVIAKPQSEHLINDLVLHINKNIAKERVIIITDDNKNGEEVVNKLRSSNPGLDVSITNSPDSIKLGSVEKVFVVVITKDNAFGKMVFENIKVLDYKNINAYGLGYIPYYNAFLKSNRENLSFFTDLKFKFLSDVFINEYGENEKEILKDILKVNCCTPTKYMVTGYDIFSDLVDRMNLNGDINNWISDNTRLSTRYKYKKNPSGVYINTGVRLIQF